MFKNYLKIAWRNISRRRFYSALNILGLASGILFTLLIGAYVWNELQVNKKLKNADRQYFLRSEWKDPNIGPDITTIGPLSKRLKEDYPNLVANYYRWDGITSIVSKGDKFLREGIQLGDSTLLSMFGFELLHGDRNTALNKPFSVVVDKRIAEKYFGRDDVVGETLGIQSFSGSKQDFTITGVLGKLPDNSVTHLNDANDNTIFIPTNTYTYFGRFDFEAWANLYLPSYIELREGVKPGDLEKPIQQLLKQNASAFISENLHVKLVPLSDFYLNKDGGIARKMIYALSFVGLFILLMAIINFVNIAISGSSSRIREIGIRKVMGGLRRQIMVQFLVESVILVALATLIALLAYPSMRPLFEGMVGRQLPALTTFPLYFSFIPAIAILLIGLLAGLYPALVLSSLKSVDSIKGKLKTVREKVWLRKSLAGFQFAMASIVIVAAFVVTKQIAHFFGKGLGYNKEFIVSSQVPRDWTPAGVKKMETIRNEFATLPQVSNVTLSYEIPNGMNGTQPSVYKTGSDSATAIAFQTIVSDNHYLETYQVPLLAGSYFRSQSGFDSSRVVINEKAVATLGWKNPDDAIGKQLRFVGSPVVYTVSGVAKDFHFASMQEKIHPFIFLHTRLTNTYRFLSFKLKPGDVAGSIAAIERKWATLMPGSSFEYRFMDDTLKNLYKSELQLRKAAYTATILSVIIVLLGVIGLISISIQKRTKEIGIRKVVGASAADIISLFMKDYLPGGIL